MSEPVVIEPRRELTFVPDTLQVHPLPDGRVVLRAIRSDTLEAVGIVMDADGAAEAGKRLAAPRVVVAPASAFPRVNGGQ